MGQYYRACIIRTEKDERYGWDDYRMTLYNSFDYGNGQKLTEHSYIGNEYADTVMSQMLDEEDGAQIVRFAHIGDYCEEDHLHDVGDAMGACVNARYIAWSYFSKQLMDNPPSADQKMFRGRDWYANNIDKEESVSFLKQPRACKSDPDWDVQFNPLFLLCALGNGLGGGDYHGMNEDIVGTWAFDQICLTEGKPMYEVKPYYFQEE